MAETVPNLENAPKAEAYAELYQYASAAVEGIRDEIAVMATLSSLIHYSMGFLWTGFYRVVVPGKLLRVGPYQGAPGCLEIEFGKGVCGSSAARGEAIIVADVEKFPGHISCDARSRSEIVIPVRNKENSLIAVLDVDSGVPDMFDAHDQRGLEKIVALFKE